MLQLYKEKNGLRSFLINTENSDVVEIEKADSMIGVLESVGVKTQVVKGIKAKGKSLIPVKTQGKICSECGKEVPKGRYLCHGKCPACYQRGLYLKKHGEKKTTEKKYECIDCGTIVFSSLDIEEVECPNNIMHKVIQK